MNTLATQTALVATLVNRYSGTLKADIVAAIKIAETLDDAEKLLLCFALDKESSFYKLMDAVLTSDFTQFGFAAEYTPVVDDAFRNKVLAIIKDVLETELAEMSAGIQSFATSFAQIEDSNLLTALTA
jgi:hypothetical protein